MSKKGNLKHRAVKFLCRPKFIENCISTKLEDLIKLLTDYIINLNIKAGSDDWKYHTELMQIRDEMISSKNRLKIISEKEPERSEKLSSD